MTSTSHKFILTAEIVKGLKCSLCEKYLSVPPIYIISEDGTKYRCGRCSVKTHINTRAIVYENLAKFMRFPCIYKNCDEKLAWKVAKEHEKQCKHKTVTCIAVDCNEDILKSNFAKHYREKHDKMLFKDSITKNLYSSYGISILEKHDKSYVVLFDYDIKKFGIEVCAVDPTDVEEKQFEVLLSSSESKLSFIIAEQPIAVFDEGKHCGKCLRGACKSEFHIHKYHRKGLLHHMPTKIEKEVVRKTFGSGPVTFKVDVVEKRTETEDDLAEFLSEKDMVIDEVNDEEEAEEEQSLADQDFFKKILHCSSCKTALSPPIFQCLTGHTLCQNCKNTLEKCRSCEANIESTRNYILEEVATSLQVPETDAEPGMDTINNDREILCPMPKCFDQIQLCSISNHFKERHIDNFHFNTFSLKNIYAYYNIDVLVKNGKTYLVLFDFDDMNFGIGMCSIEQDDHEYEITLSSANNKFIIVASRQKIIPFNEKEHCFKCSIGICKQKDHIYRTNRKEIFRRLITKINRDCIRRMLDSNNMNYSIKVIDVKNVIQKDKLIRQMFECPICKDYMFPSIHQCVAGHSFCSSCKQKLEKCPSCEGALGDTRNLALEEVANTVDLPCQFEVDECSFRANLKRIAAHELECPRKPKKQCIEAKKEEVAEVKEEVDGTAQAN